MCREHDKYHITTINQFNGWINIERKLNVDASKIKEPDLIKNVMCIY